MPEQPTNQQLYDAVYQALRLSTLSGQMTGDGYEGAANALRMLKQRADEQPEPQSSDNETD